MIDQELTREYRLEWFKNIMQAAGLIAGLVVAIVFLLVAAGLVRGGHGIAGSFIATVDLTALVSVFIYGVKQNQAALPPPES